MSKAKKVMVKVTIVISSIFIITLLGLYIGRNNLLQSIAFKRIQNIEATHEFSIRYDELWMKGLDEIILQGLSVIPVRQDTLLTLKSLDIQLNFWQLLGGDIEVQSVHLNGLNIFFNKQGSVANYDFLFRKEQQSNTPEEPTEINYTQRIKKILNLLYGFLPENGKLSKLCITERQDSNFVSIHIPSFIIKNNCFHSDISVSENTLTQHWTASGELNRSNHTLQAELTANGNSKLSLPYINRRFGAQITFDTLTYSLTSSADENLLVLTGKARISGLDVYHKALSPEIIHLNRGQLTYQINIAPHSLELDSVSTVLFNKLSFHPYLRAEKSKNLTGKANKEWHITASTRKPWFPSEELFGSIPHGLFSNLDGIQTSGSLAYLFLLDVDFVQLDSLKFVSELKERDFRIVKYGATNLGKMSEEFIYTAYENGQPVRTFPVGSSWEHFTPLDSISPLLQMSVLQSEDGAFFYHQGFLPDAMREALIHDLKVKRFARGGSTISMQLVKNVFLNRNKNFSRKLEEALIVWLIETERLTPKERMYEVYLNLVEWGPMVYGAREATTYYFNKRPSQLTAAECIFLASIIPKPKRFRSSFTEDMRLKENMEGYYTLLKERLVKKGLIDEAAADSIRATIEVTGEARKSFQESFPDGEVSASDE